MTLAAARLGSMRIAPLLLAVVLVLPGAAAAQGSRSLSTRLTAPGRVAGFRLESSAPIPGGARLRYTLGDSLQVDASLLPLPTGSTCRRACDSVAVDAETEAFARGLPGLPDSMRVERDDTLRLAHPGGTVHGRHLALRGSRAGRPVRSHHLLYGLGGSLVRVRATFPPGERRDSLVARFAGELVAALARPAEGARACAAGPADPEHVRLAVDSRDPLAEVRARAAPALGALGFTLAPGRVGADSLATEPVEGWPAGIDYGAWARERSPGFVVGVRLEERGARTRITVTAEALCAPAAGAEDPRAQELALELHTANRVLAKLEPHRARP
ncbi:MAG TPA: hypothetical protein VHG51_03745 [Longimicrobiaceae bacterium]|nr:hypothetical protein [Longimicrobiaceae bacterium]